MREELTFDTVFQFYPIELHSLPDGRNLAISTKSANWIVLNKGLELELFQKLQSGLSIGELINFYGESDDLFMESLQTILAKIEARKFAGTAQLPEISKVEGFKMLNIYVTNSCNLRCPHCFMSAGVAMNNEMTTAEIKRILTEFKQNSGEFVTFTGGEPMMRKDFVELLHFSKEIGLINTVLSNGLLWKDEDINNSYKAITEIQISIDGVDDKTNSSIRGIGNFNKAVYTAKEFAKRGVKTSIATTFAIDDLQLDIIPKYLKLKSEIEHDAKGDISFKFSKKILPGRGVIPTEAQNQEYMLRISAIENAVRPNAKIENFMLGHEPNMISRNCGIGGISIRADGHVFFCNRVHEVDDYGHIFTHSMKEWMEIGKELNEYTSVDNVEPCRSCYLKNICNGGCRIDDFSNKGKMSNLGPWRQLHCNEEKRVAIIDKMVQMFDTYYDFSQ